MQKRFRLGLSISMALLAVTVGLVLCAVLVFGEWRLRSKPPAQSVSVTLIAKDVPISVYLGPEQRVKIWQ